MQSVKPQLSIPPLAYLVVHSLHLVTVHLQYQLTDFQAASLERSPVLVDVNYTGQRMLRVGTSFDCDAQNGFRFLHRDMQIASVVRYDIGAVVHASNCSAAATSMLLTLMTTVGGCCASTCARRSGPGTVAASIGGVARCRCHPVRHRSPPSCRSCDSAWSPVPARGRPGSC